MSFYVEDYFKVFCVFIMLSSASLQANEKFTLEDEFIYFLGKRGCVLDESTQVDAVNAGFSEEGVRNLVRNFQNLHNPEDSKRPLLLPSHVCQIQSPNIKSDLVLSDPIFRDYFESFDESHFMEFPELRQTWERSGCIVGWDLIELIQKKYNIDARLANNKFHNFLAKGIVDGHLTFYSDDILMTPSAFNIITPECSTSEKKSQFVQNHQALLEYFDPLVRALGERIDCEQTDERFPSDLQAIFKDIIQEKSSNVWLFVEMLTVLEAQGWIVRNDNETIKYHPPVCHFISEPDIHDIASDVQTQNIPEYLLVSEEQLRDAVENGSFAIDSNGILYTFGDSLYNVDTSQVKNMSFLFSDKTEFDEDIGYWDVSNVTTMEGMFEGATSFNQDISQWNVANVKNMEGFLWGAIEFNQDIGYWDVSNVTNMVGMLAGTFHFNHDIGRWDVSNVTDMSAMFFGAEAFNQDIGSWNVSNVTNMNNMFNTALAFNQDISRWDVSNVTRVISMFSNARSFNQDIGSWDVSSVTSMNGMFFGASEFNKNIGDWNVSNVTDMGSLFWRAMSFNQDLDTWNVSNVTDMRSMFSGASSFNGAIGSWDVSKIENMEFMFSRSLSVRESTHRWQVFSRDYMERMEQAHEWSTQFNQDLSDWDVSNVSDMNGMFFGATSFSQRLDSWDVSNVKSMVGMFAEARSFNQDISNWNVSNVSNMYGMFTYALSFNQNIGSWDVSNVNIMLGMFAGAESFDQSIGDWDLSSVRNIFGMFFKAKSFNQDLSRWILPNIVVMPNNFIRDSYDAKWLPSWNIHQERYEIHDDGTVTDNLTQLKWQRCAVGQTWIEGGCQGSATGFTLNEMRQLEVAGWRVPNVSELRSLVFCSNTEQYGMDEDFTSCSDSMFDYTSPTIDIDVFPDTPTVYAFWTSTPDAYGYNGAWYVSFSSGMVWQQGPNSDRKFIRLVSTSNDY